jgi:deoxyribose-phosphate aldolase
VVGDWQTGGVLAEITLPGLPPWTPSVEGTVLRVPPVDAVGLEDRAAALGGRSVKREAKLAALGLLVRCIDLTTLEGADTPERVRSLCAKARRPDPSDPTVPPVAAVCVYPELVPTAVAALAGSGVRVASVAGAFPSGLSDLRVRLEDIRAAVAAGADEIDIVLNRSAFLSGDYRRAFDEVVASRLACGPAHLKVILEVGELGSYDQVRRASALAMAAGADFIKTSTGKVPAAATLPMALCMAEAIRDFADQTGRQVGFKAAGGVRTAKQGWQYLVVLQETLGPAWLTPDLVRVGASSLLNDVLLQLRFQATGRYPRPQRASVD